MAIFFSCKLATRFRPVMLTSIEQETEVDCDKPAEKPKMNIKSDRLLSYECSRRGFRFFVHAINGEKIAYSRYFPSQSLMKRMLQIIKLHIETPTVIQSLKKSNFADISLDKLNTIRA